MTGFLLAFVIGYGALAIINLRAAALLTLALTPTYLIRFQIFGLPSTLLEIQIIILFLAWLVIPLKNGIQTDASIYNLKFKIYNFSPILLWGIAFIILGGLVSIIVSPNWVAGAGLFRAFILEPLIFVFVLFHTLSLRGVSDEAIPTANLKLKTLNFEPILWPLGASAALISLFAIFQYLTGSFIDNPAWAGEVGRRATSFFTYPNGLSLFVAPICASFFTWLYFDMRQLVIPAKAGIYSSIQNSEPCLPAGKFITHNSLKIFFKFLIAVISFAGVITAVSKGALIGLVVALAIVLLLSFQAKGRLCATKSRNLVIIFSIILAIAVFLLNSKFQILNSIFLGSSGLIRFSLWQEMWQFMNTHWLFGAGWNGLVPALALLHKDAAVEIYSYPHNLFLNFWATLGLSGLLGLLFILSVTFKKLFHSLIVLPIFKGEEKGVGYRIQHSEFSIQNLVLLAGLLTILIQGLVDVPFFKNDLAILWWVFIIYSVVLPSNSGPLASASAFVARKTPS